MLVITQSVLSKCLLGIQMWSKSLFGERAVLVSYTVVLPSLSNITFCRRVPTDHLGEGQNFTFLAN
jgi:hypothetical protein